MSIVGQRFAYRERVRAYGEPVRPVEVTKEGPPRSNKARVRWLDGEYEGLEEWVPKIRLLAPLEEAEALLEDERRMLKAVEVSEHAASDEVKWEAVGKIFGTMSRISDPSEEVILGYKAIEEDLLIVQNLEAATRRLGLDKEEMLAEPYAYVERSGWYKAPFQTAVKVAKHCCRQFPREVLGRVKKDEDELRQELVSGNLDVRESWWVDSARHREYAEERLRELEPVHALIRRWCGQEASEEFDEVLALRREEVDRLRNLVQETAWWLKNNRHPVKAGLLRKELGRIPGAGETAGRSARTSDSGPSA
jgi:hypothetical protein